MILPFPNQDEERSEVLAALMMTMKSLSTVDCLSRDLSYFVMFDRQSNAAFPIYYDTIKSNCPKTMLEYF